MDIINEYLQQLNETEGDIYVEDILECLGEDVTLSEFLDFISEGKTTSRARITRQTKIKKAQSSMSTAMARQRNDPLYKRMKIFCTKCKDLRVQIHKKYGNKNISRARK